MWKKKYLNIIWTVAFAATTSCGNTDELTSVDDVQYGFLSTGTLQIDAAVTGIPFSRAAIEDLDFVITITKDGEAIQSTEFRSNNIIEVPVGTGYEATVHGKTLEEAAFEVPYYEGETETAFDIKNNLITELPVIKCHLQNIKVSVVITDRLAAVLDDAVVTVGYENSTSMLTFTSRRFYDFNTEGNYDGHSGYFPFKENGVLTATFSGSVDSNQVTSTSICDDLGEGQHRILYYGLKDETGDDPQLAPTASHDSRSGLTGVVVEFQSLKK